jgi:hypothetical protein
MDYYKAQSIRKTGLSDLIADQIASGGGIGSSIGKGLSQKTSAAMTGIKQRFDPLNIAKFVTGGSNLAPAMLGRLTGRKQRDIKFFTGKKLYDTASKIKPVEEGDGLNDILGKMLNFMQSINASEKARRDKANQFAEENASEKERRHKELIEAITGKPYTGKTAAKIQNSESPGGGGIVDDVLSSLGLAKTAKSALGGLGKLAKFAVGPIGLPLLAAAAIGGFGYFIYKALKEEPSYEAEQEAKGIRQAESVGGLAGVKDEEDRIKKLPEYERTMAELINYEKNYNEGEKLGEMQLAGFAKRGSESARAVEDYKVARDKYKKIVGEPIESAPPAAAPMESSAPSAPTSSANEAPAAAPASGAKLNQVQSENLNLNIPESKEDPTSIINNNSVKSYAEGGGKIPMPTVRNMEETFQRMILYSTKVV